MPTMEMLLSKVWHDVRCVVEIMLLYSVDEDIDDAADDVVVGCGYYNQTQS